MPEAMEVLNKMIPALRGMAKSLEGAVAQLTAEPTAAAPEPPKLEQVRAILAEKSRQGHTEAIRVLLEKFNAAKLSAVDPQNYAALLAEAEALK